MREILNVIMAAETATDPGAVLAEVGALPVPSDPAGPVILQAQ